MTRETRTELWSKTLLFIGVVLAVNALNWMFGGDNILVGISLLTAGLMLPGLSLGLSCKTASVTLFLLMPGIGLATCSYSWNVGFVFAFHVLCILAILLLTGQNYAEKSYLPFLLCYIFLQANPVSGTALRLRLLELLLGGAVLGLCYYVLHRKDGEAGTSLLQNGIALFSDVRTRFFALQLSLGISVGILLASVFHLKKVLWITAAVLSLTQLNEQERKLRTCHRFQANLIGYGLFFAIVHLLIPKHFYGLVCLLLGYVNGFLRQYKHQQIVTTMNVLIIADGVLGAVNGVVLRFSMLLFGSGIVSLLSLCSRQLSPRLKEQQEVSALAC